MSIWCAVIGIIFISFIPPLKLDIPRIIFRPSAHCNYFEDPPNYVCSIMNQKFYTTNVSACDGNVTNATSFYIISMYIPSNNQYITNRRIYFYPDNLTDADGQLVKEKEPYWLPKNYCIQEYKDDNSPFSNDQLRVAFYSWNKNKVAIGDTGYINRSDLEENNTGWYMASNCMLEITRKIAELLSLENYCITGYVSRKYIRLPKNMLGILHDNEHN